MTKKTTKKVQAKSVAKPAKKQAAKPAKKTRRHVRTEEQKARRRYLDMCAKKGIKPCSPAAFRARCARKAAAKK